MGTVSEHAAGESLSANAQARIELLAEVPLLSGLDRTALQQLLPFVQRRSYFKNAVIISEGDPGDSLFIVETGKVRVFLSDPDGKEIVLCSEERGGCLGEIALLDGEPRSASVITVEKTTFLIITRDDFRQFILDQPEAVLSIFASLTRRIRKLTSSVKSLALRSVYSRIVEKLDELAEPGESEATLVINERLTHQDVADRVGASREMVSRILRDLSKGGYIDMQRDCIKILRPLPAGW